MNLKDTRAIKARVVKSSNRKINTISIRLCDIIFYGPCDHGCYIKIRSFIADENDFGSFNEWVIIDLPVKKIDNLMEVIDLT